MTTIETTVASELVELIPVVAGAIIAFAGSGIKYWIEARDRRKQIKREKLERLLGVAHELMDWTSAVDDHYIFREKVEVRSIMDEMVVLASLYFRELADEVNDVVMSSKEYKRVAIQIGTERMQAAGNLSPEQSERIKAAYSPLVDAIEALTLKAEEQSTKLL